jgi:hypothetical protein
LVNFNGIKLSKKGLLFLGFYLPHDASLLQRGVQSGFAKSA